MATILDSYAPFDSGSGSNVTEDMWRSMMRHAMPADGVLWYQANEFQVYADSTGMQVKVKSGECWIEGHWGSSTTEKILAIATANATNPRIDSVVLRANFNSNDVELDVLTGTAAASPVQPTLTQSTSVWEIRLANIAVAANAVTIASGNVTDKRQFTGQWQTRPMCHVGRTGASPNGVAGNVGFQALSTNGSVVGMGPTPAIQQGCTFVAANNSIRVDRRGRYRVIGNFYYTNGTAYTAEGWLCKNYSTDNAHPPESATLVHDLTDKPNSSDFAGNATAIVDLELNDEVRTYIDATWTWGTTVTSSATAQYQGSWMSLEYVGQIKD